jgi:adenylate cyclase
MSSIAAPDRRQATRARHSTSALSDWLIRQGRLLAGNNELFAEFCERVAAAGVPIDRASLHLRALHPQYRGVSRTWKPGQPLQERFMDHGIEKTAMYIESPVHAVTETLRTLQWRLDDDRPLPFSLLEELRDEGYVHYVIAPFVYAEGLVNAISWATARPGGFTEDDLQFLDDVLPALAVTAEVKALRRFIPHVLTTYVGEEPGRLILEGQVRRGDVTTITAALMLIDLRDFTLMSDTMTPRAVVRMLNDYFDDVIPPVREHGGEVMEIMGDGVLAIFRRVPGSTAAEACSAALAAARQALAATAERNRRNPQDAPGSHIGIALHYGTVSYGNIGTNDRLDFTVIGPDVNLVSRIERLCRELDRSLIMTEAFTECLDQPVWELGAFELRGFSRMQRLFELPHDE